MVLNSKKMPSAAIEKILKSYPNLPSKLESAFAIVERHQKMLPSQIESIMAVQNRLLSNYLPQARAFQANKNEYLLHVSRINKQLELMLPDFQKFFPPHLAKCQRTIERCEEDKRFRDALESLGFSCFLYRNVKFGFYETSENTKELFYATVEKEEFANDLLKIISEIPPLDIRADAILSGICLHKTKNYHASSMILSAQIEGIISDFLEQLDLAVRKDGTLYKLCKNGEYCLTKNKKKKEKLIGMDGKIKHVKEHVEDFEDFLSHFTDEVIDSENSINLFRNALMHGDKDIIPSRLESTKLLYWLSGLIVRVYLNLNSELTFDEMKEKNMGLI